jgi:ankyrin repeat protein
MSCNTLKDALSSELILHAADSHTVKQLLMNGADINYQSKEGWCLLFELISLNLHQELASLRDTKLNIEITDAKGRNALFWSIYHEHLEVLDTLISIGCKLTTSVTQGLPALHYAVYKNNTNMIKLLLDSGVDIEIRDSHNNTALAYANLYKREEIITLLTRRGASTANLDY